MNKRLVDVLVIGAGPAGLAAAIAAKEDGIDNLLVLDPGNESIDLYWHQPVDCRT